MPLYCGGQRIAKLYRGATPIARAYKGAALVFGAAGAVIIPDIWNDADKGSNITLSESGVRATGSGTTARSVRSVTARGLGKWYLEIENVVNSANAGCGILDPSSSVAGRIGGSSTGWEYTAAGQLGNNGSFPSFGSSWSVNDVIGIAIELAAGTNGCKLWFAKNNAWQASGNPATGASPAAAFTLPGGGIKIGSTLRDNASHRLRADPVAQTYAPPAGFTAGWGADG